MILEQIEEMLEATGYPVAYSHFNKPQTPPFLCYKSPYSKNFMADGEVYLKQIHIEIELYTSKKEPNVEAKVEFALASFIWQKTETFIESENIYQIIYETEVVYGR